MSAVSEINNFLSRKAWITIERSTVKSKGRNPAPANWVFKSKEEPDRSICFKSRNIVKGYTQAPVVDCT